MIRTSIVLPRDVIEWLKKEAEKEQRSFAAVVRMKLEAVRAKQKRKGA